MPLLGVFEDGRISTSVLRAELSCQGNLSFSLFPVPSSTSSTRGNIRRFPHPSFLDGRGKGEWLWQATTTKETKEAGNSPLLLTSPSRAPEGDENKKGGMLEAVGDGGEGSGVEDHDSGVRGGGSKNFFVVLRMSRR